MRRIHCSALAITALCGVAGASDLKLDGQTAVTKQIGTNLQIDLTGSPNLATQVAVDVSPGPVSVLGELIDLGLTPSLFFVTTASTNAAGLSSTTVPTPNNPALIGSTFYLVGAVLDPADPNGFDFSSGASLSFSAGGFPQTELAGKSLTMRPFFERVRAINLGDKVEVAIDPLAMTGLAGKTADIYVTAAKSSSGWDADATLTDVSSGGAETVTFSASGVQANTFTVDTGTLAGPTGTDLGVGYDIVIDVDQDGLLSAGDVIDGYADHAGFEIVRDTTQAGPYAVTESIYSGGTWLDQDTYYPTNIASLGQLPLVIISHGNGHNYQWYDHIGYHLASYGYVVMSHSNNTGPGIQTASTTTLDNTDKFIGNLASILGGKLNGHVDSHNITWIGHSRGGEGVARAYDKIVDGTYVPTNFALSDIKLISSMAPTDFLGTTSATPHDVPYHLWVGQADSDVNGCPSSNVTQCFHLLDRAENQSQSTSLKGVGHTWFHDNGGFNWASGPQLIGEANTHLIQLGYFLPLLKYHIEGDWAARDFLTRQYEDFHPISAPVGAIGVEVDLQFRDANESGKFVIDDFQTNLNLALASSGAAVSYTVQMPVEGRMDDGNSTFTNIASDVFNGFTEASATDFTRGLVFNADGAGDYDITYDILPGDADWTSFSDLSFRACQSTRHPLTTAVLGDSDFEVELVDTAGNSSVISILASGAGLTEPYQRTGCGTGSPGWGNEFETVRLQLEGFTADDAAFDLSSVDKLIFRFGPSHGSAGGRYGLDDIALTKN